MPRKEKDGDLDLEKAIKMAQTEQFWRQVLLREPMPEDPRAPIQDYVQPAGQFSEGTQDLQPNRFDDFPGFDPKKWERSPSYLSPRVPGTLDAPSIRFPEDPKTRA